MKNYDKILIADKNDVLKDGTINLDRAVFVKKKDLLHSNGLTFNIADNRDEADPKVITLTGAVQVSARMLHNFYYMLAMDNAIQTWCWLLQLHRKAQRRRIPRKVKKWLKWKVCLAAARNTPDWTTPYGVLRRLNQFIKFGNFKY